MKNNYRLAFLWICLLGFMLYGFCSCATKQSAKDKGSPALFDGKFYEPPVFEEWSLPNGLSVIFHHDQERPLMTGTLFIYGGRLWESAQQLGSVSAMGKQLRAGGAGSLSADALDQRLGALAAEIESEYRQEYGEIRFSCLTSDFKEVFALLSDIVLKPRFEKARLDLWKKNEIEGIKRRKEHPSEIAEMSFMELIYASTAYGRIAVESDIKRITRLDLLRMHRKLVRPNKAILVLRGDLPAKQAKTIIQKKFASWTKRNSPLGRPASPRPAAKAGIYFIEAPFSQATIFMGHRGTTRFSDDLVAISGFNQLFGAGGFGSQLMQRIREDLGLVYSIYGLIQPELFKGPNFITFKTKSKSTALALVESLKVLQAMQEGQISEDALSEMKRAVTNSFVFKFDPVSKALKRAALLKLLAYPRDYDRTYIKKIHALKIEDIVDIASKQWNLEKFVVVVVGNQKAYNLLKALVKEQSQILGGLELKKLQFNQKLQL